MENQEIWKPWPRNPFYQISNQGRVKGKSGKILTVREDPYHYLKVDVDQIGAENKINGKTKRTTAFIHRMLMETFYPVDGMENLVVDHIDGDRSNNNFSNLRWVTQQENMVAKIENHKEIDKEIARIIAIKGYEKTLEILQNIE